MSYHISLNKINLNICNYKLKFHIQKRMLLESSIPDFISARKVLFIHIPKAAGRMVSTQLYGRGVGHYPASLYKKIDTEGFCDIYKFSVVRNPWDRLYSAYVFLCDGGMSDLYKGDYIASQYIRENYKTFEEYVHYGIDDPSLSEYIHFIPQSYFVYDRCGNLLVDKIYKIEEKNQMFLDINSRFGTDLKDVRVNASSAGFYKDMYTSEMIDIVYKKYRIDVVNFGYVF